MSNECQWRILAPQPLAALEMPRWKSLASAVLGGGGSIEFERDPLADRLHGRRIVHAVAIVNDARWMSCACEVALSAEALEAAVRDDLTRLVTLAGGASGLETMVPRARTVWRVGAFRGATDPASSGIAAAAVAAIGAYALLGPVVSSAGDLLGARSVAARYERLWQAHTAVGGESD